MFDIHCHMLPAVDDGADSLETACAMARAAAADGVRAVILTPHCSVPGARFYLLPEQILDRTAQFQAELFERDIRLDVLPGAEVLATSDFPSLFARGEYLTLNRSRYFLVEFAFEEDPAFTLYIVETIASAGLIPVIAHPERYFFVYRVPDLLQDWRRLGALLQINKGSLSGRFGEDARYTATRLLTGRRASLIASDAHGVSRRTPILSHCQKAVEKLCGTAYSKELFVRMPARILDDLPPDFRKPPAKEEAT